MSGVGDCPCGCDDCTEATSTDAAYFVRQWLDRERMKPVGLQADQVALLERCAEDLEVGI